MPYKINPLTGRMDYYATPINSGDIENRLAALEETYIKIAYYEEITGISGQISIPAGAEILLDQWANGVDAIISEINNNKPTFEDSNIDVINFDISGNYTLSDNLPTSPAALIFYFRIKSKDLNNIDVQNVIEYIHGKEFSFPPAIRYGEHLRDDFTGSSVESILDWRSAVGNGGLVNMETGILVDEKHPGIVYCRVRNSAVNERAALCLLDDAFVLTNMRTAIEGLFHLSHLADVVTDDFRVWIGWGNNNNPGNISNGIYFLYDYSISNNWMAICEENNTQTVIDTNIPISAGTTNAFWSRFAIDTPSDYSRADFLINDAIVATITTNLPASPAPVQMQPLFGLLRRNIVGSNSVFLRCDYFSLKYHLNSRR